MPTLSQKQQPHYWGQKQGACIPSAPTAGILWEDTEFLPNDVNVSLWSVSLAPRIRIPAIIGFGWLGQPDLTQKDRADGPTGDGHELQHHVTLSDRRTTNAPNRSDSLLDRTVADNPELKVLASARPTLPPALKAGIRAMVKAALSDSKVEMV